MMPYGKRFKVGLVDPLGISDEAVEFGGEMQREQARLGRYLTAVEVLELSKRLGYQKVLNERAGARKGRHRPAAQGSA